MLRHFEELDENLHMRLLNHGYTQGQIQETLSLPGSTFFSYFANDIKELLEKVLAYPYKKSTSINGTHIIETTIPFEAFPSGIGTKGVVSLNEISKEKQAQIFYEKNRNFLLAHLMIDELPVTNNCNIVLRPSSAGYNFITAFSGLSAMPIPDYKMTKAQFDACKSYWDNHVFLKKK